MTTLVACGLGTDLFPNALLSIKFEETARLIEALVDFLGDHHFVKFGPTFGILLSIAFNHVAKADGTDVICALFILATENISGFRIYNSNSCRGSVRGVHGIGFWIEIKLIYLPVFQQYNDIYGVR